MNGNVRPYIQYMSKHYAPIVESALERALNDRGTIKDVKTVFQEKAFQESLKKIPRHELLPYLFKIRGEPYSLKEYPQFEPMYDYNYPVEMMYMCGRQIAKSTNLSRSEVLDLIQLPNFQALFVAPLQAQTQRYSNLYLREAITTCDIACKLQSLEFKLGEGPIIKSVGHQAFSNGSGIQMMYAKTSADRARGITADRIDFDEIQDQLVDHIPVIKESTTNSAWGLHRYTGTAKTTDNTIEYLWRQSSQAEWVIKCPACNTYNIPDREHALDMISVEGPCCHKSKCRHRLDPYTGTYVHGYPDLANEFPGYHVPQIVVPAITEDPIKWYRLLQKIEKLPESLIFTEILGISHDAGVRLLTQADIDKASCLGTHAELRKTGGKYLYRVLGVDWGIAEITSFTVSTVIGITSNGEIDVLFAKRYVGQNPEHVIEDICSTYNAYKCDLIAPDFGVGFTNNAMLRNRGLPVSQIQYVRQNKLLNYNELNGAPRWCVDRNTALSIVFWGIKHGKIRFPNKEDSGKYTSDLLSPYEHITELSSGMVSKKFLRDPSKPDDFAHALTFGSLMLMKMVGDSMLNIVPEHSINYTGRDFPEEGNVNVDSVLQAANV